MATRGPIAPATFADVDKMDQLFIDILIIDLTEFSDILICFIYNVPSFLGENQFWSSFPQQGHPAPKNRL